MIAVVQRVSHASVTVEGELISTIGQGLLVLVSITHTDDEKKADWLANKVAKLRIFSDAEGKMNLSAADVGGEILSVSQFTLHGNAKKGYRPSFTDAAPPAIAMPLYAYFNKQLEANLGKPVKTSVFGADMKVALLNDGPVTLILDTDK